MRLILPCAVECASDTGLCLQLRDLILRYSRAPDAKKDTGMHHSGPRVSRKPLSHAEYNEMITIVKQPDFDFLLPIFKKLEMNTKNVPNCQMHTETMKDRRLLQVCAAKAAMYTLVHQPLQLSDVLAQCAANPEIVVQTHILRQLQDLAPLLSDFVCLKHHQGFLPHVRPLIKYLSERTQETISIITALPKNDGDFVETSEKQGGRRALWWLYFGTPSACLCRSPQWQLLHSCHASTAQETPVRCR